ncbi:MAG: YeeE/YedE family protein [Betaproteobacteria bacterium]|nr:YeeE/YedE family protein [Betaproteobacteria bacterium]MDE2123846.1 YeeE/YedE family protein [Betaproteobacteria bacterium]MDE2187970.1 YeeE/YedE family protein [Betaproteobacteria bacterium]MDE2325888.1 YeeE/YedE family protein [Betaproteobacteria bacterium]
MTAMTELLMGAFAAAAVLGASAQATRSCPQGGLRETLLERKPARLAAYGVAALVAAALLRRDFRPQGLAGWREGARQLFGAVLGLGCTVGHGLSGVSVLSIGSMLGLASIFTGAWLAIRLEAGRRAAPLAGAPGYTAASGG